MQGPATKAATRAAVLKQLPELRHLDQPIEDGDEEGEEEGDEGEDGDEEGGEEEGEGAGDDASDLPALQSDPLGSPGGGGPGIGFKLNAWEKYNEEGSRLIATALDMLDDLERACMEASQGVVRASVRASRDRLSMSQAGLEGRLGRLSLSSQPAGAGSRPGSAAAAGGPRPGSGAGAGAGGSDGGSGAAAAAAGRGSRPGSGASSASRPGSGGGAAGQGPGAGSAAPPMRAASPTAAAMRGQQAVPGTPPAAPRTLGAPARTPSGRLALDPPLVTAAYAAAEGKAGPGKGAPLPGLAGAGGPGAALSQGSGSRAGTGSGNRVEQMVEQDLAILRARLAAVVEPMAAAAALVSLRASAAEPSASGSTAGAGAGAGGPKAKSRPGSAQRSSVAAAEGACM